MNTVKFKNSSFKEHFWWLLLFEQCINNMYYDINRYYDIFLKLYISNFIYFIYTKSCMVSKVVKYISNEKIKKK